MSTDKLTAQPGGKNIRGLEIGMDFVRTNNLANPFGALYHPDFGTEFKFGFIPGVFVRSPFGRSSLRFKYEFSQISESYATNSLDFSSRIEGKISDNWVFIGMERYFINSRLKFYGSVDLGLSLSNFSGYYSSFSGWSLDQIINEPQNITALGISLNPGVGIKYKIFKSVNLTYESSVGIGKITKKNDPRNIYFLTIPILRPISLFGLSYSFIKSN
jgi:hypothetical protein